MATVLSGISLRQLGEAGDYTQSPITDSIELTLALQLLDNARKALASKRLTDGDREAINSSTEVLMDAIDGLRTASKTAEERELSWRLLFLSSNLLARYMPPDQTMLKVVTQAVRVIGSKKAASTEKASTTKRREWLLGWRTKNGDLRQANVLKLVQTDYSLSNNGAEYDPKTFRSDRAAVEDGWSNTQ